MTLDEALDVLAPTWARWAEIGAGLDAEQWKAPSRLPGWDVHALYGHHGQFPLALLILANSTMDGPLTWSKASDVLASFNQPAGLAETMAPAVQGSAIANAEATSTADLLAQFAVQGPESIAAARASGEHLVDYFGHGVVWFASAVKIMIVEAVVHGLDVVRALDIEPDFPSDAVALTRDILAAVAPPVDFIEAATGRSAEPVLPVLR
jgi:uncharacterized protein (TIGR03083 family)